MKTTLELVNSCQEKLHVLEGMIPVSRFQKRLDEIDHQISDPIIWENPKAAAVLMKERQKLSDLVYKIKRYRQDVPYYIEFVNEFPTEIESIHGDAAKLYVELSDLEFKQMMREPTDDSPAIMTINQGAGGLESANWVSMLYRMYLRYANSVGFKIELLDMKESEEHSSICTDSVSFRVEGQYAYGFLKSESGVHRLIRNSPFNSGDARHTSFAAVSVVADILPRWVLRFGGLRAGMQEARLEARGCGDVMDFVTIT